MTVRVWQLRLFLEATLMGIVFVLATALLVELIIEALTLSTSTLEKKLDACRQRFGNVVLQRRVAAPWQHFLTTSWTLCWHPYRHESRLACRHVHRHAFRHECVGTFVPTCVPTFVRTFVCL